MTNPCPGYSITTRYKQRGPYWSLDRDSRGWGLHTGADLSGPGIAGTPILSATPGKVIAANAYDRSYGYKVIVRWGNFDVWYCHMPKDAARVTVGQTVSPGQRIGAVGSTGNVTGAHLHLELRVAGGGFALANFRDPQAAIDYAAAKPDTTTAGQAVRPARSYTVATTALNGRGGPGTDYRIKGNPVPRGESVTAIRETTSWVMTSTSRWFSKAYLTTKEQPKPKAATLRVGTFNLPDAAKLPDTAARIREGVKQVLDADLDVVGYQELVNRKSDGVPSAHAKAILEELGDGWSVLTPKGHDAVWSEDYTFYRIARVELVKQFDDVILPSGFGNRHMGSAIFRDKASGREFHFTNTHLVDGKDAGAGRTAQGRVLEATSHTQAAGRPRIIVGDFNRSDRLPALVAAGMLDTRTEAKATTNADYATHTKWAVKTPSKDPDHVFDHIEVSAGATVNGYTIVGISGGKFVPSLRPSDHQFVIASITLN